MGLLSWFFPSPADRVASARRLMDGQRWAEARLDLLELDHPDAAGLVATCETELARMNLVEAVNWARAGDEQRLAQHLELAEQFARGGLEDAFRDARREMRELRAERTELARRAQEAEAARQMSVDPLGMSGGPSWLDRSVPTDLLDAADEEAAARLALVVENYAQPLRASVGALGPAFARAILDHEDGRPDLAVQALLELPDDHPVVRYERARAAYALGDPTAAARELRVFATQAGGHHPMGRYHTGEFLALCLAESGRADEGLRVLRSLRASQPKLGAVLYAQLLELTGDLPEAERVLADLIRNHPKDTGLYKLLARVRVAGGERQQAMVALEAALTACACAPGKCGYQPPDVGVLRGLATLYLEDGVQTPRGIELAGQALGLVEEPTWEDAYLRALAARAGKDPQAPRLAEALWEHTPPGDARHARLTQFLPA
jgi:tetratricopeptide (TPR) repeat protein